MTAYELYLESEHWRSLRDRKLKASGFFCNRCRSPFDLQVHHVYYRKSWYDCDLCDLEVVCRHCHEQIHRIRKGKFKKAKAKHVLAFTRQIRRTDSLVCARY